MSKEKINELTEEIEIEKVTFTEWWALMDEGELPKRMTKSEFQYVYMGYWNWCWFRMVEPETKEEVKRYVKVV